MSDRWSFRGTTFRRLSPDESAPRWFPQQISRTVDVVAGDVGASPRRFVDIGAREFATLQITAGCDGNADAAALEGALGLTGTLVNVAGRSGTALLVRADRLIADGGPFVRLSLEFEFVQ